MLLELAEFQCPPSAPPESQPSAFHSSQRHKAGEAAVPGPGAALCHKPSLPSHHHHPGKGSEPTTAPLQYSREAVSWITVSKTGGEGQRVSRNARSGDHRVCPGSSHHSQSLGQQPLQTWLHTAQLSSPTGITYSRINARVPVCFLPTNIVQSPSNHSVKP